MKKTEIWQAKTETPYKFLNFKKEAFSPHDYELVFEGETSGDLDEIYAEFNTKFHREMKGHSLSVSDIIVFPDENKVFYVQVFGFLDVTSVLMDENNIKKYMRRNRA